MQRGDSPDGPREAARPPALDRLEAAFDRIAVALVRRLEQDAERADGATAAGSAAADGDPGARIDEVRARLDQLIDRLRRTLDERQA